jgi:hypothetical protein
MDRRDEVGPDFGVKGVHGMNWTPMRYTSIGRANEVRKKH